MRSIEHAIEHDLAAEVGAEEFGRYGDEVPQLLSSVPGAFAPGTDVEQLLVLARSTSAPRPWGTRQPDRRVVDHLGELLGAAPGTDLATMVRALLVARASGIALAVTDGGGTAIESSWDELARADAELALGVGSLVADRMHAERTVTAPSRAAVAALATSLRADRSWRRIHLESLDGSSLLQALPLWIGTLRDIDDLLPPDPRALRPGHPRRGRADRSAHRRRWRCSGAIAAVVVGDPHQLRHDPDHRRARGRHRHRRARARRPRAPGSTSPTARSTSRPAAAAVTWLDEHFRSAPAPDPVLGRALLPA